VHAKPEEKLRASFLYCDFYPLNGLQALGRLTFGVIP